MRQRILVLTVFFSYVDAVFLYDDEISTTLLPLSEDLEFQPVNPLNKEKRKIVLGKNINCEDFSRFALNCTLEAAMMYNSSRKAPPMPAKLPDWCRAIRHLTNCAVNWNSECREVTESHFNEESIKGHKHVIQDICDDEWFLTRYDGLPICIEATADVWEACYTTFKLLIEEQKNKSDEWTHYEIHFYLCCARAQFRRCTLDSLFGIQKCTQEQASTLQKYSIIVSKGDVYQDCDFNMMYENCPGGDPRPSKQHLSKLVNFDSSSSISISKSNLFIFYVTWFLLYCTY